MSKNKFGLTTTKAEFIEKARDAGQTFIHQPFELYTQTNHETWKKLFFSLLPKWERFANDRFLKGLQLLHLNPEQIPRLEEINKFLEPLTGFQAKAVSGYVPTPLFFHSLKRRQFPTTITIRDPSVLNYLPEPDIFHDIAGHVPMHTDPTFANVLVHFGSLARRSILRHAHREDLDERIRRTRSNLLALSRFFWFTIEFGLMKRGEELCVYGSGLLSSAEEIEHAVLSANVQRSAFRLDWVIHQSFLIDEMQPLLFYVDSFDHLFEEVKRLECWLEEGRLDFVAGGEPLMSDAEIQSFFDFDAKAYEEDSSSS